MDWDNPEERAALAENIGIEAYNKAFEEYVKKSTIKTVGGHAIRSVGSRFGSLFQCGNTGKAFSTLQEAEDYATENPIRFIGKQTECPKTDAPLAKTTGEPTKAFSFGQCWQVYGTNSIRVPAHFTIEQAIEYVKTNWDSVGLAKESSYVQDSDEPDFDNCDFKR